MPTIYLALANMSGEVASSDVAVYLGHQIPNSRFSAPEPQPNTKGSADVVGVLATIASVADIYTLASALMNVYSRYVQPFKERNPSSALAIRLDDNGKSASLMIDADTTREIVIENLCATNEKITAERIRIKGRL
ncbi:MAG: hypothetical protein WC073_05865 [Sterolibacterium sp.]